MKKLLLSILLIIGTISQLEARKPRILIGSVINEPPDAIKLLLSSFEQIEDRGLHLEFFFIDHNDIQQSTDLLEAFTKKMKKRGHLIPDSKVDTSNLFITSPFTTDLTETSIWTIAEHKNEILRYGKEKKFDYVFLIDSRIIVHPKALKQLIKAKKDIIANIFWRGNIPQVWLRDLSTRFEVGPEESISEEEAQKRTQAFISKLKAPGVYEVGGLGACTLISRSALKKGACFDRMKNLSYSTEDSHFCIRACAIGIPLYVDTHYPAYVVTDPSNETKVMEFLNLCKN